MNAKPLFNNFAKKTHMPFYSDGTIVFCTNDRIVKRRLKKPSVRNRVSEYRPWKIAMADWSTKRIRALETGLPEESILCNPMFFVDNGELHVSFIAGIPDEDGIDYRLYEMHGGSLDALSPPKPIIEESAKTGFLSPRHLCFGDETFLTFCDRTNGNRFRLRVSLDAISRATFDPDRPERVLITGPDYYGYYRTIVYDTDTGDVQEIKGPAPAYKACLVGNRVVFSYRESEDIEDYQLRIAPLDLRQTQIKVVVDSL